LVLDSKNEIGDMGLKFVILRGKNPAPLWETSYQSAYRTFETVWNETFKSIAGNDFALYSNDFTRQDYIQAIFDNNVCVALDCVRHVSLKNYVDLKDSWLASWPQHELSNLARSNNDVLINSYFTVHPDFRKTVFHGGLHIAYLMGCLSVLYQLELASPLMLGMMRNERSMNKLGLSWGATPLKTIVHNGTDTDLVAFYELNVRRSVLQFPSIVLEIFNQRTDYTKELSNEKYKRVA
jgi:hypothetical protein